MAPRARFTSPWAVVQPHLEKMPNISSHGSTDLEMRGNTIRIGTPKVRRIVLWSSFRKQRRCFRTKSEWDQIAEELSFYLLTYERSPLKATTKHSLRRRPRRKGR